MWGGPAVRSRTHHGLERRQAFLPTDVDEPRRDDDHAHGADDDQDHEQFAVVAARFTGPGLTAARCAVVLDPHLDTNTPEGGAKRWSYKTNKRNYSGYENSRQFRHS